MYQKANYRRWLTASGLCPKNEVQGVGDDKIAALQAETGLRLPEAYKDFLRACGHYMGEFAQEIDLLHFSLPYIREDLDARLGDGSIRFKPPADAFFFLSREGRVFNYFLCDGNDDPAVWQIGDGDSAAIEVYPGFSGFIKATLAIEQSVAYADPDRRWMNEPDQETAPDDGESA